MSLLVTETQPVGFTVRIIFYIDVIYGRKIRTYSSGPIKIRKNILSLICATSEGKQGLKGKFDCYFASILGVCVETADQHHILVGYSQETYELTVNICLSQSKWSRRK